LNDCVPPMDSCEEGCADSTDTQAPKPREQHVCDLASTILALLALATFCLAVAKVVELVDKDPAVKWDSRWIWLFVPMVAGLVLCCLLCWIHAINKKHPLSYKVLRPMDAMPQPKGLRLVFDDCGTAKAVYAKHRPLGIKHFHQAPIVVASFPINSYAKLKLGVKKGWELTHIGNEELSADADYEEVLCELNSRMKDLPLWPLPLTFVERHSSEPRVVRFQERPLGIEFNPAKPTEVHSVLDSSPAQQEGVQLGWRLTKIGDYDVPENQSFSDLAMLLKQAVEPLNEVELGEKSSESSPPSGSTSSSGVCTAQPCRSSGGMRALRLWPKEKIRPLGPPCGNMLARPMSGLSADSTVGVI